MYVQSDHALVGPEMSKTMAATLVVIITTKDIYIHTLNITTYTIV